MTQTTQAVMHGQAKAEGQVDGQHTVRKLTRRDHVRAWSIIAIGAVIVFWLKTSAPASIAFDVHDERCLDVRAAFLVHGKPATVARNDMLVFPKLASMTYLVRENRVMKMVAGLPGDRLQVIGDEVRINGAVVSKGLPLLRYHRKSQQDLQRDEIIPARRYYMMGTHPLSDDSRYWGYLSADAVTAKGFKLF